MAENLGAAIYGLVTVGALLSAESAASETYADTVVAVVIGILLIWLTRGYGDFTERRARSGEGSGLAAFGQAMRDDVATLMGGSLPLLAVVISWLAGASLDTAVTAGVATAAVAIVVIELIAGLRSGLTGRRLLFQTLLGAVLGLLILALRLALH